MEQRSEQTPKRGRGAGRKPRTAALTGAREPMLALPGVDGRELWPRQANKTYSAIVQHCGGPESITEIEALTARRVADFIRPPMNDARRNTIARLRAMSSIFSPLQMGSP